MRSVEGSIRDSMRFIESKDYKIDFGKIFVFSSSRYNYYISNNFVGNFQNYWTLGEILEFRVVPWPTWAQ